MKFTKPFYLIVILCVCLSFSSFSQYNEGQENITVEKTAPRRAQDLKETTLLVVIDDEQSDRDQAIMDAFDKHWKYNKHKFIKRADIGIYEKDKRYSFFLFSTIKYSNGTSLSYEESGFRIFFKKIHSDYMVYYLATINSESAYYKHIAQSIAYKQVAKEKDIEGYFAFWLLRMQKRLEILAKKENGKLKRDKPSYTYFADNGKQEVQNKEIYFLKDLLIDMDQPAPDSTVGNFWKSMVQDTYFPVDSVKSRLALNLSINEDKIHFIDLDEMNKMMGDKKNASAAYIYDGVKLYDNEGKLLASVSYLDARGNAAAKKMGRKMLAIVVPSMIVLVGGLVGTMILLSR